MQELEAKLNAAADAALWLKNLRETSNEIYMPFYFDKHRFLVLMGGGGSGKSIFAGRKILERATSEVGHRILVCRKVARTLRESCFVQLREQLLNHYPRCGYKINQSDMKIKFDNGNEIIFAGLDDVEKLKSIFNITAIWIEEASELNEGDFNQLDIRLRGKTAHYKQIILTFNPISITHWLKKRFFDNPVFEKTQTLRTTYKDNRFLDSDAIKTLEDFKDTDEYYYTVYCLGQWGSTGHSVFDSKAVGQRLSENIVPCNIGFFEYDYINQEISNPRFIEDKNGAVLIYRTPEEGVPYVIGADTAGDGSDANVAQVIDNSSGEQVAVLYMQSDEDVFTKQLYCLGKLYNNALVAVETNFSTYPVLELERLEYKNQFVREVFDDFTHSIRHSFGYRTDMKSRPVMIANLIAFLRNNISCLSDRRTLEEMLTFVRNADMRAEAENGAHDDCVMALCIAHMARGQQSYLRKAAEAPRVEWREDQWEDYRRASPEDKKRLRARWGNPK